MNSTLILNSDIENLKISSLPTNPTADANHGGLGYNASAMKAAFDALPLFLVEKYNSLIRDILAEPESSISGELKTGLSDNHTLASLFYDIRNGNFAAYLLFAGKSLAEHIREIKNDIEELKTRL